MLALMQTRVPAHDTPGQSALSSLRATIAKRRSAAAAAATLPGSA
jgi:hypothetical protein